MKRKLFVNRITITLSFLLFSIFSYSRVILNFSETVNPKDYYPTQFVQFPNPPGVDSVFLANTKKVPIFNEREHTDSFKDPVEQKGNLMAWIDRSGQKKHDPAIGFNDIRETETTKGHALHRKTTLIKGTPDLSISSKSKTVNSRLNVKNKKNFDNLGQQKLKENNKITVTFNILMSHVQNFNPKIDSVFIAGTFPNAIWNIPGSNHALRMSDPDSNLVYSISISFDSTQEVQYKFFINAGWGGGEWQGGANRVVNITHDTTLNDIFGFPSLSFTTVFPTSSDAWLLQSTGFLAQFTGINYISIANPNVVWANAYDGLNPSANIDEFTKTIDGGKTWIPGKYTGVHINSYISNITALSGQKAWIAVAKESNTLAKNGIFVTNDGGNSWIQQTSAVFTNVKSFPDVVYFWDEQNGVCFGDPVNNYFEIYTTTNGGTNWVQVPTGNIPISVYGEYGYANLFSVYGNTFWFGTNRGRVFKSTDKGYHWTVASTGMPEVTFLGFHNSNTGIAIYQSYNPSGTIIYFQMKKSVDGGTTWKTVTPSGKYFKSSMAVVPDAPGMLISTGISQTLSENGSAYSLDDGNTWTQLDDSVLYTTVKFFSSSVGWVGGFNENSSSRGIWKWQGIPTTGVTETPEDYLKIKIFPNPSSGIVHFSLPVNEQLIEISIYNMDSKLVSSFENGQGSTGENYVIDLKNLPKGIYVAVVRTKQGVGKLKLVLQ